MPSKTFLVNTSLLVQGTYPLRGCADVSSSTEPRLMQRRGNLRVACVAHDLAGANVDGAFLASERGWDGGGRERPIAAGFSCCGRALARESETDRGGARQGRRERIKEKQSDLRQVRRLWCCVWREAWARASTCSNRRWRRAGMATLRLCPAALPS